jgi:hypothetical protein
MRESFMRNGVGFFLFINILCGQLYCMQEQQMVVDENNTRISVSIDQPDVPVQLGPLGYRLIGSLFVNDNNKYSWNGMIAELFPYDGMLLDLLMSQYLWDFSVIRSNNNRESDVSAKVFFLKKINESMSQITALFCEAQQGQNIEAVYGMSQFIARSDTFLQLIRVWAEQREYCKDYIFFDLVEWRLRLLKDVVAIVLKQVEKNSLGYMKAANDVFSSRVILKIEKIAFYCLEAKYLSADPNCSSNDAMKKATEESKKISFDAVRLYVKTDPIALDLSRLMDSCKNLSNTVAAICAL